MLTRIPILILTLGLLDACAFTDRALLLKEYSATLAPQTLTALAGRRVHVSTIDERAPVEKKWTETTPTEVAAEYVQMSGADEDAWDDELNAIKARTTVADWNEVGWVRNGFGMHTADVFAVNSPVEWLTEKIQMELAAQGAVPVATAQEADTVVRVHLLYMKVDIAFKNWADLVVEVDVTAPGKAPARWSIHTTGSQVAWSSSSFEFYNALRRCEQKLMHVLLPALDVHLRQEPQA